MANFFIVGASSGIGQTLAKQLAAQGHQVFATYNRNLASSDLPNLLYTKLDALHENPNLDFLPDTIQGFVYCPGSINLRPFGRIQPEDFVLDFRLQVVGAIRILQTILPRLKRANNASALLFSTVAVQSGLPFHTQVSVSKGAIEGLVKSLAAEFAPTVRVNAIAPSLTDTPLASALLSNEQKKEANALRHPMKRIGSAKDIADMAEYLLSEKGSWITGQIFHVDGGMSTLRNGA